MSKQTAPTDPFADSEHTGTQAVLRHVMRRRIGRFPLVAFLAVVVGSWRQTLRRIPAPFTGLAAQR